MKHRVEQRLKTKWSWSYNLIFYALLKHLFIWFLFSLTLCALLNAVSLFYKYMCFMNSISIVLTPHALLNSRNMSLHSCSILE